MGDAFTYDGGRVGPGETRHFRFPTTETYLGDPIRTPVTVVNGPRDGPTAFLAAAAHGDELNGVEVVRRTAEAAARTDLAGTLVCLPVLNVLAFLAQQRYLPGYDQDLNRAFPGDPDGTTDRRIAHRLYENFVAPCDFGLDFHTSTRGRTNVLHVRADVRDDAVARLASAFGTNLTIAGPGERGMLRRAATVDGVPTVTVEMGRAHSFEQDLVAHAIGGVESVLAEYGMVDGEVRWPGWRAVVGTDDERAWLRSNAGGIVDVHVGPGELVEADDVVCTVSDPFGHAETEIRAPFPGVLVGVLENPVVYPGNPVCHLAAVGDEARRAMDGQSNAPPGSW